MLLNHSLYLVSPSLPPYMYYYDTPYAAAIVEVLLVPLSFLTGQLIHLSYSKQRRDPEAQRDAADSEAKARKICTFLYIVLAPLSLLLNTAPVGLVMYSWINGSVNVFNVTYIFNVPKSSDNHFPNILMSTESTDVLNDRSVIDNLNEYEVFAKLVMAFFTVSSALSFLLFIYALVCTYKCDWLWRKCATQQGQAEQDPLDPFQYNDPDTSTKMELPESLYFICLLTLNICLWIACLLLFYFEHFNQPEYYNTTNNNYTIRYNDAWVEKLGFFMYMYSLLCTIVSCFIFSKIAYSVTRRCLKLYDEFKDHERVSEDNDGLEQLVKRDLQFTKMAQATIIHFEYWFTVHWIFYTVTSFLSIALLNDTLQHYIYSTLAFSKVELIVIALFTLQHCFLFLYPCFKAAAVTVGREKLIKKVNAHLVDGHPLTLERKQVYIQHLRNMKFGFRISFFCARLRFGFNVAYISIFIGLLGVLLRLTGVI